MINVQSLVGSMSPQPFGTTKIGQSTVDQPSADPNIAFGQYVHLSHAQQPIDESAPEKVGDQEKERQSESFEAIVHSDTLLEQRLEPKSHDISTPSSLKEETGVPLPSVQGASHSEASDLSELARISEHLQKLNSELKNQSSSLPYANDSSAIVPSNRLFTPEKVTASQRMINTSVNEGSFDGNQRIQSGSLQALVNSTAKPVQVEGPTQTATSSIQPTPLTAPTVVSNPQPVEVTHSSSSGTLKTPASGTEWASMQIDTKAGKWGEQMMQVLHDRVTLQAQQNMQEAKIRLDPPELGKLDLLVRVEGDRLNVQINANAAATREALVQISERLRAELQQQNFVHVDVNVGSDQRGGQQNHNESQEEANTPIFSARESSNGQHTFTAMSSEHWLNTQA
ncbi:flagellar hook-length control protein FliK [Vibrio rotiferianus]|uniref:flagellar hook-length control protein FliK n=1 Tax=Vibrio rotiferianus TaxID=190895 RepID=UPI001F10BE46|nr:flagellar hook-length control protein FliK [Vibrio rotiferianus]